MSKRNDLYQSFYKAQLRAHPQLSKEQNQRKTYSAWNDAKKEYKSTTDFDTFIEKSIKSLELTATQNISQKSLLSYFGKNSKTATSTSTCAHSDREEQTSATKSCFEKKSTAQNCTELKQNLNTDHTEKSVEQSDQINNLKRKYSTPSQNESRVKIQALESQISSLTMMRDSNLGGSKINEDIKRARLELKKNEQLLKQKTRNAENQKKFRLKEKQIKLTLKNNSVEGDKSGNSEIQMGRPSKEIEYPELLNTICDIAIFNSAADERRQTEEIRTCTSLQDLTNKLQEKGFNISRSAVYLRLLPRRSSSIEGIRHVKTVPVRLCKPQNDLHKNHPDSKFCAATIKNVDTLASMLGPKQVAYISQDDKARVKIGITAANKQSPRLMHVEYRIKLPDHDWVVASKHTLIPSVYAGIQIKPDSSGSPEAVSYSGPSYISIRSGKHSSSTAATHANDIDKLFKLESFREILYVDNEIKPILIISVDGGPDENPRYHKTIAYAIQHFKKYSLDALFIMTNAPGRSAFNRVERRMAPLSRALSGIILPHTHFGNHLNSQNECNDEELELKNFAKAGEILQDIWSEMTIDKYPVTAKYITPDEVLQSIPDIDYSWHQEHVRESQYFLQIVKCNNRNCCSEFRSDIKLILKDRFFPPPLLSKRQEKGRLTVGDPVKDAKNSTFLPLFQRLSINLSWEDSNNYQILPYDYHCHTLQDSLCDRICPFCNLYFASLKKLGEHRKAIHPGQRIKRVAKKTSVRIIKRRENEVLCIINKNDAQDAEWCAIEEVISSDDTDSKEIIGEEKETLPIIKSIIEWLKCDWIDEN